jgi:hypothetical protein
MPGAVLAVVVLPHVAEAAMAQVAPLSAVVVVAPSRVLAMVLSVLMHAVSAVMAEAASVPVSVDLALAAPDLDVKHLDVRVSVDLALVRASVVREWAADTVGRVSVAPVGDLHSLVPVMVAAGQAWVVPATVEVAPIWRVLVTAVAVRAWLVADMVAVVMAGKLNAVAAATAVLT